MVGEDELCVSDGAKLGNDEGSSKLDGAAVDKMLHSPHKRGQLYLTSAYRLHRHHVAFLWAHLQLLFLLSSEATTNRWLLSMQLQLLHVLGQFRRTSSILHRKDCFDDTAHWQFFFVRIQDLD